jgi:hypothetical protein
MKVRVFPLAFQKAEGNYKADQNLYFSCIGCMAGSTDKDIYGCWVGILGGG